MANNRGRGQALTTPKSLRGASSLLVWPESLYGSTGTPCVVDFDGFLMTTRTENLFDIILEGSLMFFILAQRSQSFSQAASFGNPGETPRTMPAEFHL